MSKQEQIQLIRREPAKVKQSRTSYTAGSTGHQKALIKTTTTQEGNETQNKSRQCPQGLAIMVDGDRHE